MLILAPLVWRATAPRAVSPAPAATDAPATPPPTGAVDTARVTPESLRFL
jgi:hypothetical protein